MPAPKTYISTSHDRWTVIHNGLPICADKLDVNEAIDCANAMKVIPTDLWDGDEGEFNSEYFADVIRRYNERSASV